MLIVPMAIDAGIGEFARTGRVLSPEFGINMRLKAVTTDLPLEVDHPISFGVHEFCMACESCAVYCPAQAVPFGEPKEAPEAIFYNRGFRKWYVKADRCLQLWMADRKRWITCGGKCIAVVPEQAMNAFHNLVRFLAIHSQRSSRCLCVPTQFTGEPRKLSDRSFWIKREMPREKERGAHYRWERRD
jgi:epoxyqueuosine reductase QueG